MTQFNDIYNCSSFVLILGGAFQGKSLLSIKIAEHYNFSAVFGTDCFRNILRIQKPTNALMCSTSHMTLDLFNQQRDDVSLLIYETLKIYAERKEKIIIEGIHISEKFLEFLIYNGAHCFYLDNQNTWSQKVDLKKITTPITRVFDQENGSEIYEEHTNETNINNITYIYKEGQYTKFHNLISSDAKKLKVKKISYTNINLGFHKIRHILDKNFSRIDIF